MPEPKQGFVLILAALIFAIDFVTNGDDEDGKKIACNKAEEFVAYAETRYPGMFDDA